LAILVGAALVSVSCSKRMADPADLTRTRPLQLAAGPVAGVAQVIEALDGLRTHPMGVSNFDLPNQAALQVRPPLAEYNLDYQRLLGGASFDAAAEPDATFLYLVEASLKPVMVVKVTAAERGQVKTGGFRSGEFVKNFAREYGVNWGNAQYATDSKLPAGPYEIRFLICQGLANPDPEGIWFKAKDGAADFICSLTDTSWGLQAGRLYTGAEFRAMLVESIKGRAAPSPAKGLSQNTGTPAPVP
jgi:hypothetical protein